MEYRYEILYMEFKKFVLGRFANDSFERTIKISVGFSGSAGDQMGWRWCRTCGRIHIFLWKGE
jgi:hypothetical protein